MKYVILRGTLDETILGLERWQHIFNPTWFLILRIENAVVNTELAPFQNTNTIVSPGTLAPTMLTAWKLRRALNHGPQANLHVSLPDDRLDWDSASPITHSNTRIIRRTGSALSKSKFFAVYTMLYNPTLDITVVWANAERLAKKLKQVDPTIFALPSYHGLVKRKYKGSG